MVVFQNGGVQTYHFIIIMFASMVILLPCLSSRGNRCNRSSRDAPLELPLAKFHLLKASQVLPCQSFDSLELCWNSTIPRDLSWKLLTPPFPIDEDIWSLPRDIEYNRWDHDGCMRAVQSKARLTDYAGIPILHPAA